MAELETLIKLTTEAITQHASSAAKLEALHEAVGELKKQTAVAMTGINDTQSKIVLALERLNVNIEDHKVLHHRIDDLEEAGKEQRARMDGLEHTCSKEVSEETAAKVENIERLMIAHGIWDIRDGEKGHAEMIGKHERFVRLLSGKIGWTLLAMIIIGTVADFVFHYDFIKRITGIFTG